MYRKFISAFQMLNILLQALYSLALPIGIGALAVFLLTEYISAPKWIWIPLLIVGIFSGLYSMLRFILTATKNLDRLEQEQEERVRAEKERKIRQEKLRSDNNETE